MIQLQINNQPLLEYSLSAFRRNRPESVVVMSFVLVGSLFLIWLSPKFDWGQIIMVVTWLAIQGYSAILDKYISSFRNELRIRLRQPLILIPLIAFVINFVLIVFGSSHLSLWVIASGLVYGIFFILEIPAMWRRKKF